MSVVGCGQNHVLSLSSGPGNSVRVVSLGSQGAARGVQ